jgi:hypothetical protein
MSLTGAPAASPVVSRFSSMARQAWLRRRRPPLTTSASRRAFVADADEDAAWLLHEATIAPRAGSAIVMGRRTGVAGDEADAAAALARAEDDDANMTPPRARSLCVYALSRPIRCPGGITRGWCVVVGGRWGVCGVAFVSFEGGQQEEREREKKRGTRLSLLLPLLSSLSLSLAHATHSHTHNTHNHNNNH